MKKIISFLMAAAIVFSMVCGSVVPAFAADEDEMATAQALADNYDWEKFKGQDITLNVFNWGEYMSLGQEDSMNVNKAFEEKTGIKVNYQTYDNNEAMYTKIKSGGAEYDIVIPSDYMIGKMINEDMLQKLDYSLIPNATLYIDQKFKGLEFDPGDEYSVPYTWGVVGIIYNKTMVNEPVDSWNILWDEDYAGNILMFGNSRDAFGIALLKNGLSVNPSSMEDIETAKQDLIAQKSVVQAYVNDEIFDKMGGNEAALAPYYSGDAITMIDDNPDLDFAVPKEGTNYFVDSICILKDAKNVEAAHMYINFLCETEVALANAEYIGYATPHTGAYEMLDEETKNNPIAYPSDELLTNTQVFNTLPEDINTAMSDAWNEVRSYSESGNTMLVPILLVVAVVALVVINILRNKKKKKIDY